MIDDDSLRAVESAGWTRQFIKPLYDSYCFTQIPPLVRAILTGDRDAGVAARLLGPLAADYDTVVLFFVDAFGWRFFEQYHERSPFLRRVVRDGRVCKLTAQFPSTTAAHVTAIHTGLTAGQSGVYEWFYYEPTVDRMIAPLYYSFAGDHRRNTLEQAGVAPETILPHRTLYQDLQAYGVRSIVLQHQDYTPSPYSNTVCRGARVIAYKTLPEALSTLTEMLLAGSRADRAYYVLYWDQFDAMCHHHGPTSPQAHAELETFLAALESLFYRPLAGKLARTLFLLTADHGQVAIDPATTIYLNTRLPRLAQYIKRNREGQLLAPAGACRDMFLHISAGHLDEAQAYLQEGLAEQAAVYRVADLIAQGFFGPDPSPAFLSRVGDLVVLPYSQGSVWWYERGRFEQHYYGHHGGLTRQEMETLLLAQAYM